MFTTFSADSLRQEERITATTAASNGSTQKRQSQHDPQSLTGSASPTIGSASAARSKRIQVARACEWCRLNRIKCDDNQPCSACQSRGAECSNTGKSGLRSLPTATKEIGRLEAHVKELENELNETRKGKGLLTPQSTPSLFQASQSSTIDPMEGHQGNRSQWQGLWITAYPSREAQYSGPTSASYFSAALRSHVTSSLKLSHSDFHMQPSGASSFLANPTVPRSHSDEELSSLPEGHAEGECILSRAQEEYFLALFWQSYHCIIPILNEVDFRDHYESLWTFQAPATARKASPLVDVILALCMQYGMTFVPSKNPRKDLVAGFDSGDSTIAGRNFYRRCQTILSTKLETPTIMTLQCQIFSAVYLNNASFVNLSHNTVALAIRTAHTLGLHQESRNHPPRAQQELHRRLWWVVYTMESTGCMNLGRPWLAHMSQVSCALPADDHELAMLSGPSFASSIKDITWLSYHVHHVKLILTARAIHTAFANKCAQVLSSSGQEDFHGNAQSIETLAGFLVQILQGLRQWVQSIPDELKTERREGGKSYTTDRSAIQVDLEAPQWLQRQRLSLELTYHNLMMNLYRPFIAFAKYPSSSTPLATSNNISCLNHAIAITIIILPILKSSDILNGWHEACHLQWNAALTMVGFIFANPVCPPTPTARRTMNSAIEVFEIFRYDFTFAASAADVTRDLAAKVDSFLNVFRTGSASVPQLPAANPTSLATTSIFQSFINNDSNGDNSRGLLHADPGGDPVMDQTVFPGTMGENMSMDPFVGAEWPLPEISAGNPEMWSRIGGSD